MHKSKEAGFTLIELLVTVGIIALIASIALLSFQQSRLKARDAKRQTDVAAIRKALDLYQLQNQTTYPNTAPVPNANTAYSIQLLSTFLVPNAISAIPNDPKANATGITYHYAWTSNGREYSIFVPRETGGYCQYKTSPSNPNAFGSAYPSCNY